MNKTILMGQTTYDNLPNKLEGRHVIVVSADPDYTTDTDVIHDLIGFLETHKADIKEYIICGGASIYNQAYKYCNKAYVSFVKGDYQVDTYFDKFDLDDWNTSFETEYDKFTYKELLRKPTQLTLKHFSEHELEFSDGTVLKAPANGTYDRVIIEEILEAGK